jgi:ataxia telangiectasia mutated family protein
MSATKSAATTSRTAASSKKKSRLETFLEICHNFKPVFRHFFMENYADTSEWYAKRLNYTRSVATSSIVGYMIGLGDRHVQNILIDVSTADVVHIDLGIAFDQGKILVIPETIPFR